MTFKTFKTFKTLSLALVSLLSMGLAASGQPVDFEASDVVKAGSTFSSWAADTPAWMTSIDKAEVETRDLEVRAPSFSSPLFRAVFAIGLGSNIIKGAAWTFEFWVVNHAGYSLLKGDGPFVHLNTEHATVALLHLRPITMIDNQFRGAATFRVTGYVGTAQLVVEFVAEVFASKAATIIQSMIRPPMATLAGMSIPVTSWRFDPLPELR